MYSKQTIHQQHFEENFTRALIAYWMCFLRVSTSYYFIHKTTTSHISSAHNQQKVRVHNSKFKKFKREWTIKSGNRMKSIIDNFLACNDDLQNQNAHAIAEQPSPCNIFIYVTLIPLTLNNNNIPLHHQYTHYHSILSNLTYITSLTLLFSYLQINDCWFLLTTKEKSEFMKTSSTLSFENLANAWKKNKLTDDKQNNTVWLWKWSV